MNSNYSFFNISSNFNNRIINYFFEEPIVFTEKEVKDCARILSRLLAVSKNFPCLSTRKSITTKLENLKETCELIKKYCVYNKEYNPSSPSKIEIKDCTGERVELGVYPGGNPQLVDALATGSNIRSTFKEFTEQTIKDISRIMILMPLSLHCSMGEQLPEKSYKMSSPFSRKYMGPLTICCLNRSIPIDIIKILIEQGVPTNKTHLVQVKGYDEYHAKYYKNYMPKVITLNNAWNAKTELFQMMMDESHVSERNRRFYNINALISNNKKK